MRRHYRIEFEPNQNLDISDHNKNTLTFYSFCICNWMNMKVEMPAESASVIHHNCYRMGFPEPTERFEMPMELEVPTTLAPANPEVSGVDLS